MDIDKTFKFLNFIVNKNQSGNITPEQFNIDAERSQIDVFNRDYNLFLKTGAITDLLDTFLVPLIVNPDSSGQVPYPSDYAYAASFRHLYYVNNIAIPVAIEEVENGELGEKLMSQLSPATAKYPVVSHFGEYIQFYPKTLKGVQWDYFRIPTVPVWGYTVVSGRPVYNASTSVDLEVPDSYQNQVVAVMLSYMGMYLSAQQVVGYAELMKKETAE